MTQARRAASNGDDFEIVRVPRTPNSCPLCEDYCQAQQDKPIAVLSCEGACVRGEIARQVANLLSFEIAPEKTVRICLGSAFTKDLGQRELVRSRRVLALEGCFIECASRMMRGVIPELEPEIIHTDALADFDKGLFGINEMSAEEIATAARKVALRIAEDLALRELVPG